MSPETMTCTVYNKRPGTSGLRGQLYETKLISLIHFRAIYNDSIEEFHLATNVDKIGAFDDICFKAKVKGFDRPVTVFIQAKHKENEKQTLKNDLAKYFDSYLKIRHAFGPNSKDVLFEGKFDKTECLFVIYTTAKDDFENNDLYDSSFASNLNDLIGTGGTAKQPYKDEQDIEFLCKIAMKEEIISMAERMTKFICDEVNFKSLLNDELVLRYHVILAQKVIDVSEIQPEGHRLASFRQDFFYTNEEFLILLKDTLYTEILKRRKLKDSDKNKLLSEFFKEPFEITRLSKLIGTVITYNNGRLEFVDKMLTEDFKRKLNEVHVSLSTVSKAVELAAKEILSSRKFKVPIAFGNKDLTISGNIERRLHHLESKIFDLLDKSKSNHIVTIDESLEKGLLQLNGGIAGAVGNILVPDENTKLMKFTDNYELLGALAKRLFIKLKSRIHNLSEYKFNLKVKTFPKLSFDCSEYEENLAKDFLNKLLFYSNQADENTVEEILKNAIEHYQRNHVNNFQVRTDAIYLKYHDKIQKWWKTPKRASYLTKEREMFESAINNIVNDLLISVINMMYMNKIQQINYTFNNDALSSLNLQDQYSRTVIITESSTLTVAKVIQCLKNKEHVVLDLEYILNLPTNDRYAIRTELTNANEDKVLIFVCEKIQNSSNGYVTLEYIATAVHNKKAIIITNHISVAVAVQADNIVYDIKNNLIDMSEKSQKSILETARTIFQGKEISLDLILDVESKAYVGEDMLNRIMNKETIIIGKQIENSNYDEMKHLYVDRRVKKTKDDEHNTEIAIETLHDIVDDVVLITAKPGMGKSTLLTHLSRKTKELDPKVWIVRINLLEHSRTFHNWKKDNTAINTLETLTFLCQVILCEKLGKGTEIKISLEEENGVVHLKDCTGDQWTVFELKLFLHFYNREKLIILFDGFDEICPHYTDEVMKCLKTISNYPRKHRMWVTSRSYNEVKSILQQEFGTSYEIEPFSHYDTKKYLELFWKFNLILKEFNSKQLENVHDFIKFTLEIGYHRLENFEYTVHYIYLTAAHFLRKEIANEYIPLYKKNIDHTDYDFINAALYENFLESIFMQHIGNNVDGTPLNLYLIADYFENKLKDLDKKTNKWDLGIDTFTIYERYLETKLKKIRFQDKNKMDIYNPDVIMSYDKERTDSIIKHKQLAAYAIFHRHSHKLFDRKTLEIIKETIKLIEKGREKTGLIYSVANNIPIFVHMTFTEYFAAEHVCDLLKSENCSEKQKLWMDFIFNVMFSMSSYANVRDIFGYKLKIDKALMSVIENNKEVIFELLMEHGKIHSELIANFYKTFKPHSGMKVAYAFKTDDIESYWSLSEVVKCKLHNFKLLYFSILESYLNESNLDDFLEVICGTLVLPIARQYHCNEFINFILDIVRKIDKFKLSSVVLDNFCYLSRFMNYDAMTNEEICKLISKEFSVKYDNHRRNAYFFLESFKDHARLHLTRDFQNRELNHESYIYPGISQFVKNIQNLYK